jgi:hypothetical protein
VRCELSPRSRPGQDRVRNVAPRTETAARAAVVAQQGMIVARIAKQLYCLEAAAPRPVSRSRPQSLSSTRVQSLRLVALGAPLRAAPGSREPEQPATARAVPRHRRGVSDERDELASFNQIVCRHEHACARALECCVRIAGPQAVNRSLSVPPAVAAFLPVRKDYNRHRSVQTFARIVHRGT